ncbi:SCP-like protein, partial [Ancylostoma duodenale]
MFLKAVLTLSLVLLESGISAIDYGCPTNPYIDDFMRDVFVGYHRVLRRRIAKGGQQPNNQGFLGPAKNIYDLKWDCDFEKQAHEAIEQCNTNPRASVSQNIASGNRPSTELWESGQPCQSNGDCTTYEGSTCDNGLCVDSENKAGVTYTRDGKKSEEKKPSGNEKENDAKDKEFDRSKEGERKKNGGGRDEGKKPTEEEGRKRPSADKTEQRKTTKRVNPSDSGMKTTPRKPKENGSGDKPSSTASMCPGSKITAKARELFLALHNEKRRNIALGKAPNNVGFLGPAKNMYKMDWKCEYEKWAQSTVDSCNSNDDLGPASNGISFAGNGNDYRKNPYQYINETFLMWANGPQLYGTTNVYENWNNYYFGNDWKCEYEKWAQSTVDSCNSNGDLGPASNGISFAGNGDDYRKNPYQYINETFLMWANGPQLYGTTNVYENWNNYYFGN